MCDSMFSCNCSFYYFNYEIIPCFIVVGTRQVRVRTLVGKWGYSMTWLPGLPIQYSPRNLYAEISPADAGTLPGLGASATRNAASVVLPHPASVMVKPCLPPAASIHHVCSP